MGEKDRRTVFLVFRRTSVWVPGHGILSLELEIPVSLMCLLFLPLPTRTGTGLSYRKTENHGEGVDDIGRLVKKRKSGRRRLLALAASFCRKLLPGLF
jgi:hypothetical protein